MQEGFKSLSFNAKLLLFCCFINILISFMLAYNGEYGAFFSFFMAMYCGLYAFSVK